MGVRTRNWPGPPSRRRRASYDMRQASALLVLAALLLADSALASAGGISDPGAVLPVPTLPRPAAGASYRDPVFDALIQRVSDLSESGGFETPIYSQLQAFSADNVYLLTTGSRGYQVRRVADSSLVPGLDLGDINVPRWHPTQPHVLVHFDTNADADLTLQFTDVDSGLTTDVATLPGYTVLYNNQSFDELSRDGRWIAGMARRSDQVPVIFAYDLVDRRFGAQLAIPNLYAGPCTPDPVWGEIWPDWLAPSPLGNYLVVQWPRDGTERCAGLETFDIRTGAFVGRPYDGHQHGDLGLAAGGQEFFMTFELYHPSGDPYIGVRWLPGPATGVGDPDYLLELNWGIGEHISCQGPPGVCLVSSGGGDESNGWQPFETEAFLLVLDGSVLRLAHTRSSSCGYWAQPRATISRDGRLILYASDWGIRPCRDDTLGNPDPYLLFVGVSPPPPTPPVADAGPDQIAIPLQKVTLDGTGSTDPNGGPLTYAWAQVAGPRVRLKGAKTAMPAFRVPFLVRETVILTFELTVTDDEGATDTDRVDVTVREIRQR